MGEEEPEFKDFEFYLKKTKINEKLPKEVDRGDMLFNKLCQCDCNFLKEFLPTIQVQMRRSLEIPPILRGLEGIDVKELEYQMRNALEFNNECKCPFDESDITKRAKELGDELYISDYIRQKLMEHGNMDEAEKVDFEIAKDNVRKSKIEFKKTLEKFKKELKDIKKSKEQRRSKKGRSEGEEEYDIPIE